MVYEKMEFLFGKCEQAYLLVKPPFSEEASVIYANSSAKEVLRRKEEVFPVRAGALFDRIAGGGKNIYQGYLSGSDEGFEIYVSSFAGQYDLCMLVPFGEEAVMAEERMRQYKAQMESALDAAYLASRAKTNFLSEMSHDIRTPMNAIVGMTDIALNYTKEPARVEDCLNKIRTASGHLMELINEVLDMSRIESGRIVLQKEQIQLADQIHAVLVIVRPQAKAKNLSLHISLDGIVQEDVIGDSTRIRQIMLNLLSNAIKYTPEGGNVWFNLSEKVEGGTASLFVVVKDDGIGMSEEFLEKIFQPFEREVTSTVNRIEGTGLGMSIVKNLIEMMGGTITVKSKKGEGSEFSMVLPLPYISDKPFDDMQVYRGKRVLIMQGAFEKLEKLPDMLARLGMEYDIAKDGYSAVDLLNDADIGQKPYFAMLTADCLKDIEISQFLSEIRERKGRDFPILLLSENDWDEMEYLMTQIGINAFIPLPLFQSRLAQSLYQFTEEGRRAKEAPRQEMQRDYSQSRLLLVEDNELNREIAQTILSMTKISIDMACDGCEAVEAFKSRPEFYYDLILMDIKMPVMDGLEATRKIRALNRRDALEVPIVAMTANAFAEDRQISLEAGMNDHITKPLDVHQVLECLDRMKRK